MTHGPGTQAIEDVPTYPGRGDPGGRFADYYPAWFDELAGDVNLEGSMLDGAVQGADAIRAAIGAVRGLYDRQDFNFAGPWGDNAFIEDYTADGGWIARAVVSAGCPQHADVPRTVRRIRDHNPLEASKRQHRRTCSRASPSLRRS